MTSASGTARTTPIFTALFGRLLELPAIVYEYQRKRAVYLRTMRELESYRPRELADLRIDSGDIETIARKQAGL